MWFLAFALASAAEPTLTDDAAIVAMIKGVVILELPKLRDCYEPRLAEIPDLRSRYRIEFTVLRDGTVGDARATFERDKRARRDEPLRACIEEQVAAWRFQPIRVDQPVMKTVTFRPREKEEPGRP